MPGQRPFAFGNAAEVGNINFAPLSKKQKPSVLRKLDRADLAELGQKTLIAVCWSRFRLAQNNALGDIDPLQGAFRVIPARPLRDDTCGIRKQLYLHSDTRFLLNVQRNDAKTATAPAT